MGGKRRRPAKPHRPTPPMSAYPHRFIVLPCTVCVTITASVLTAAAAVLTVERRVRRLVQPTCS